MKNQGEAKLFVMTDEELEDISNKCHKVSPFTHVPTTCFDALNSGVLVDLEISRRRMAKAYKTVKRPNNFDLIRFFKTVLPPIMAKYVCKIWDKLGGSELPLPMADRTADGERFQLVWSYPSVILEIEILPNGQILWFGYDHKSEEDAGNENPVNKLPEEIGFWLKKVMENK